MAQPVSTKAEAEDGLGLKPSGNRINRFPDAVDPLARSGAPGRGLRARGAWCVFQPERARKPADGGTPRLQRPPQRLLQTSPRLQERLSYQGAQLSGGEQQMLSIGRALMTYPELLVLDEATEAWRR